MNSNVWGPSCWLLLHSTAFNQPERIPGDRARAIASMLEAWFDLLPCSHCRASLMVINHFLPYKKFLASRAAFFYWTYAVHNIVNQKLGKAQADFEQVVEEYTRFDTERRSIDAAAAQALFEPKVSRGRRRLQRELDQSSYASLYRELFFR